MAVTPGSPPADDLGLAAAATPLRRAPMALVTWAFVLLVLLIVAVLLVVKVTRGSTTVTPPPVASAPAPVVHQTATVPLSAFDTVGAPASDGSPPVLLSGQHPLVESGHPAVVYVGAEFCPYCAAERWALVVALNRFGTFAHLGATSSSPYEAFPGIETFTFNGSSYRSRYLWWSATEEYGQVLSTTAPAGFRLLHDPTPLDRSLMERYGSGPATTLPFVDIANRVVIEGADIGFSPGVLEKVPLDQIAADLSVPTSPVAQAVLGAANELTAAICAATGGRPRDVCQTSGVRAGASRLGL
jgi:hypothetical protein